MRKVLSVFIAGCLVLSLCTRIFVSMPSARAAIIIRGDYWYTVSGGKATVQKYTGPAPREVIRSLYNRTISYGGHPNPGGALSVGGVDEADNYVSVGIDLFSDGRPLLHALKATADIGYAMVCLEDLMFNAQLAPAGLPERIVALSTASLHNITADGNRPAEELQP